MNVAEAKKVFALLSKATRKSLPILGAALAKDGYIQATNLSLGARLPWDGEELLVYPRQVLMLLKGQKGEVVITREHIQVGPIKVRNEAADLSEDDFPRMDYDLPFAGSLGGDQVKSLKAAAKFANYDSRQPILEYVHLFEEGIIATDRSAVYWDAFKWEGPAVNIHMAAITLLTTAGTTLAAGNGYVRLMQPGQDIIYQNYDGPYPEVWRLIPDEYLLEVKVDAPAVRGILEPFAGGKYPEQVKVRLNGALSITPEKADPVEIEASIARHSIQVSDGAWENPQTVTKEAPDDMTIFFNPRLLQRGLTPFDGEVTWQFRTPEELVRLRRGNVSTVVLPMMQ